MKKLITPLLAMVSALTLSAQTLTNVTINPSNPTECTFINLHIIGTLPTNGQPQSAAARRLNRRYGRHHGRPLPSRDLVDSHDW